MEEDVGVKATVTRLRRRLSVEQSEDGSIGGSPGPATPTKKRGGRLAAKPQLELIEENTPVSSPRNTRRKSLATDAEGKAITPSRRSVRIKSNTSIVSETLSVQATDSPRAKRAARRYSQTGSDNEGPATPARQTRRTRKDSASSVENQESGTLNKPLLVAEMVIEEEPENEVQKSVNKSKSSPTAATEKVSPNARKSKRLLEKRNRRSGSQKTDQDSSSCSIENKSLNISTEKEKVSTETESHSPSSSINKSVKSKESNADLSESNMSLLNKLETKLKRNELNHNNKSTSALDISGNYKSKRNRTESWPALTASIAKESINFSDNELSKKRKERSNSFRATDNTSKMNKSNTSVHETSTSQSFLDTSSKRKKRKSETNIENAAIPCEVVQTEVEKPKANTICDEKTPSDKSGSTHDVTSDMAMLFENRPDNVQISVYYEDSDSNSVVTGTANQNKKIDSEDQCVPEVNVIPNAEKNILLNQVSDDNEKVSSTDVSISQLVSNDVNNSCEPMDIDETIHEDILQKSLEQTITQCQSLSSSRHSIIEETENSKRKPSITGSAADSPDRSKNDNNKSTLILSQLKDVSTTSENLKSPKSALINEVLSKSDMNEKGNKKIFKSNLSANDVKATPKQNSVQKLTMQTSTPIVSQPIAYTKKSNISKSISDTDSSEEDSDDELCVEKNEHLDDEAEEASDDYKSGDSQDEEEIMYVAENEIVERGETLSSNDDASYDTDYEKDSFVVSSDVEDNDLLSGSGDNLSMSDNDLSMNKKSKKKFNDRKLKEQKNASREMYESRHKLNTSDKNSPTPKTKKSRMRLDSSLLASDEEVVVKTKKPNRMRLDSEETNVSLKKSNNRSMLDTSVTQEDTSLKKKMNKSMQDSICNKSAVDESEITVCNESTIGNADPLQIQIKQEPKTPQKYLNMSVVQVQQDVESVQVTENNYILDQTGTDPLQATMACEYTSDSTESEEIMQNYDSVLNELNKDRKTKLNNKNASLNMGKKSKKEPIIDQLNLTQAKKSKKNKDQSKDDSVSKTVKLSEKKQDSDNEDSSSSIDLQLLFSEDNCGSDDGQVSQQNKADADNMFIPLKKSPGKTNLRDSIGINTSQKDTTLNESSKKNKKTNSSIGPAESVDEQKEVVNESILNKSNSKKKKQRASLTPAESQELEDNFNVSKNVNISLNESGMKKKKKHSLSELLVEETQEEVVNESILNKSNSKKKKQRASLTPAESQELEDNFNVSKNVNISLNESGMKKKKKHSLSELLVEETQGTSNAVEPELNESAKKKKKRESSLSARTEGDLFFIDTTGSLQDNRDEGEFAEPPLDNVYERKKKKKKNKLDDAKTEQNDECGEFAEPPPDNVYERKKKKKKNKLDDAKTEQNDNTVQESNSAIAPKSEKKKKKHSTSEPSFVESQENTIGNTAIPPKSEKKKKKHSISEPSAEETLENTAMTPKSEKRKKKHSVSKPSAEESQVHDEDSDGAPDEAPYQSEKASEVDLQNIENVSESAETGSAKKKHKKKKKKSSASNQLSESIDTENVTSNSKKRKRKSSNALSSQEDAQEVMESGEVNNFGGKYKKLKISHNEDNMSGLNETKQPKKNKKKNRDVNFQDTAASTIETTGTQTKKNKKRKHRDEEGHSKQSKISKDNSFQEVHVPRLPDSILRQLDDKPRKVEPAKVVSTSNFIVENARQKRAKPSNYLEESIYLDAKSPVAKKVKSRINIPKVLPFIPTASTSDSGFTTNFRINKLSQFTTFEAEPVVFSKENYLQKKKIKRLGTYDRYKTQMHHKMSKF